MTYTAICVTKVQTASAGKGVVQLEILFHDLEKTLPPTQETVTQQVINIRGSVFDLYQEIIRITI